MTLNALLERAQALHPAVAEGFADKGLAGVGVWAAEGVGICVEMGRRRGTAGPVVKWGWLGWLRELPRRCGSEVGQTRMEAAPVWIAPYLGGWLLTNASDNINRAGDVICGVSSITICAFRGHVNGFDASICEVLT